MARTRIMFFSDMVEKNGKTVRENNMAIKHSIPLGTLVEVKYDEWYGDGACSKVHARLFVVQHGRDCDGTPLYGLGKHPYDPDIYRDAWMVDSNFGEEGLTPVEMSEEIRKGEGLLEWDRE